MPARLAFRREAAETHQSRGAGSSVIANLDCRRLGRADHQQDVVVLVLAQRIQSGIIWNLEKEHSQHLSAKHAPSFP